MVYNKLLSGILTTTLSFDLLGENKMPKDPVCGQYVDKDTSYKTQEEEETFYFCSQDCMEEFIHNADEYLDYEEDETPSTGWF